MLINTRNTATKRTLFAADSEFQPRPENPKRIQGGISTTDLILSAHVSGNAKVFPQILELHVPQGATIADVTYGKGVFWRESTGRDVSTFSDGLGARN